MWGKLGRRWRVHCAALWPEAGRRPVVGVCTQPILVPYWKPCSVRGSVSLFSGKVDKWAECCQARHTARGNALLAMGLSCAFRDSRLLLFVHRFCSLPFRSERNATLGSIDDLGAGTRDRGQHQADQDRPSPPEAAPSQAWKGVMVSPGGFHTSIYKRQNPISAPENEQKSTRQGKTGSRGRSDWTLTRPTC